MDNALVRYGGIYNECLEINASVYQLHSGHSIGKNDISLLNYNFRGFLFFKKLLKWTESLKVAKKLVWLLNVAKNFLHITFLFSYHWGWYASRAINFLFFNTRILCRVYTFQKHLIMYFLCYKYNGISVPEKKFSS